MSYVTRAQHGTFTSGQDCTLYLPYSIDSFIQECTYARYQRYHNYYSVSTAGTVGGKYPLLSIDGADGN
jgi:hypothetical protein